MISYPRGGAETLSDAQSTPHKPQNLAPRHRAMLEGGSAIAPDVIAESEARSIERGAGLPDVFSERQRRRSPGVLFTVHRPNGCTSYSWRPDTTDPENPGHKYEQPPNRRGGAGNVLHVLPRQRHLVADISVPVIFAEGTKKMLSLVSAVEAAGVRVLVVGIVGCWNWLHDGGKPIGDMLDIALEGRRATVMFDSDMLRKWQVKLAAGRLAEYLQGRGAEPYVTYFHDMPDGSKCGADDFFAAGGKFSELRLLTRRYHPDDFERVRLTRDDALRAMVEDLERTYQSMPTATRAECTDRATMRALIKRASSGESSAGRGVVARAPVRALSRETRRGRQAQANSLRRLQDDGLLERLAEPTQAVEKHGAAYLLYASDTERAKRGQGRTTTGTGHNETPHEEKANNVAQGEDPRRYAGLYEGVHFTRTPSAAVPELRAPKCVHTWERRDGRSIVVDSEYFYRLDKTRQEIIMHLLDADGAAVHETELREHFGTAKTSLRDFRRRKLSPLWGYRYKRDKETGCEIRLLTGPAIIARDEDGMIRLLPEWAEALEQHRRATDEDSDTRQQAAKYRAQSRKYRERREYEKAGEGRAASDAREHPLRGKEHMRTVAAEREREDKERWAEEQRRKVGITPLVFLAEEMDGEYGPRVRDAEARWRKLHGGSVMELRRAIRYGPFVVRKAAGETYIDPTEVPERSAGKDLWLERLMREGVSGRWAQDTVAGAPMPWERRDGPEPTIEEDAG